MVDCIDAVLAYAQTIVIGNKDPDFQAVPDKLREGQSIVDFVRITDGNGDSTRYDGICW
jgi:GDP-mannose 6-dehydrogenase